MFNFHIGILGQVWYLIVSIPDLCNLTYFHPDPEGRDVCEVKVFASMSVYTIQHDHVQIFLPFIPTNRLRECVSFVLFDSLHPFNNLSIM